MIGWCVRVVSSRVQPIVPFGYGVHAGHVLSFPHFPDTHLMSIRGFKLRRALVAERRVLPSSIIEPLDVVKYVSSRFVSSRIILTTCSFGFQA